MELNYLNWTHDLILFVSLNLLLLIVWFQTNAFIEYAKILVAGNKFLKVEQFERESQITGINYPEFLQLNYNCFFTRLISCPYCIVFWLCVSQSIATDKPLIGVIIYYPTILLYFLLQLILKKINEE
jgi:hypothetical protein